MKTQTRSEHPESRLAGLPARKRDSERHATQSGRVWFTLSHGIVNKIYYPNVDQPNTRDFQFLISDGETFCHEEKRDLVHLIDYPERDCVFYRLTNSDPNGRYRLIKYALADPHRSVFLMQTNLEILDQSLCGKLHLYALLARRTWRAMGRPTPAGVRKSAAITCFMRNAPVSILLMGCSGGFSRRSVGYVGAGDGWNDLMKNFQHGDGSSGRRRMETSH